MAQFIEASETYYLYGTDNTLGENYVVKAEVIQNTDEPVTSSQRYSVKFTVCRGIVQDGVVVPDPDRPEVVLSQVIDCTCTDPYVNKLSAVKVYEVSPIDNQAPNFTPGESMNNDVQYETLCTVGISYSVKSDQGAWELLRAGLCIVSIGQRSYVDEAGNNQTQLALLASFMPGVLNENGGGDQINLGGLVKLLLGLANLPKVNANNNG